MKVRQRARLACAPLACLILVCLILAPCAGVAARQTSGAADDSGFLSIALPESGEVLVENRRGSVEVEVWSQEHVALAASVETAKSATRGRPSASPVSVERGENLLSIKVESARPRARSASAGRVDISLRVPARTRLKVFTSDGRLSVRGLPVALVAQTVSGDMALALPTPADASLTAHSLNGAVELGDGLDAGGGGERVRRGKFQARWGGGAQTVNLFSGRGRISLAALPFERRAQSTPTARAETVTTTPARTPRLEGARTGATPDASRVAQPAETPQEVDEDEVVRVESDLVTLNVSAVDRASGRALAGLRAQDFQVYEDGVEQSIEHFESASAPFDLLLLLDLSGSTARVTDTIRAAALRFVAATRAQDRIAIVTFAGETQVVSPLTSNRAALGEAVARISAPKGDTRLYDALAFGLDFMNRAAEPNRRRAVILMSDGLDSTLPNVTGTGSSLAYEELRSRAQEFEGVIYGIWTSTVYEAFSPLDVQPETFDLARDRIEELTEAGGGVFYEVERLEDLAGSYERVVADLGTVYSLSYRPTNKLRDGSWRAVRVRLPRHPDAVARGRRGYFAR
ncbi:MAG TPA: VWA domain-containing protein [Pyrinomonadaceae bacterium]|nr:VWA domain-containing protein [Pyrinomonadaceae bacterium]